jgi:N-acetylmuramoyl-L-alanine amidase
MLALVIMNTLRLAIVCILLGTLSACSGVKRSDSPLAILQPIASPDNQAGAAVVMAPEAALTKVEPPLPLTNRRICIDPGHDARWAPGAAGRNHAGVVPVHPTERIPLHEHDLTLSVAYRLKDLLEADGAAVCVTQRARADGGGNHVEPVDYTGDGWVRVAGVEDTPERTQPRIDWANDFAAEVMVSVHFNGLEDRRVRGTEVYYTDGGPREEENRHLAESILDGLLAEMREGGFVPLDRGIRSDLYQRYSPEETRRMLQNNAPVIRANGHDPANCRECLRLITTGNNPMSVRPGRYVAALVEVEFLSNPDVVERFVLRPDSFDIISRGLQRGVLAYFGAQP